MKTTETKKLNYLRPTISVCNILEESFILAASPVVQPGGGGENKVIDLQPGGDEEVVSED